MTNNLNELAYNIHQQNLTAGWWDSFPNKLDRHETAMMLVVSEIAEAMEGDRKDLMDDHLPQYKMLHVELADALIRLLDLAGAYEIGPHVERTPTGTIETYQAHWKDKTVPEQLFRLVTIAVREKPPRQQVLNGISGVIAICNIHGIDIFPILHAKVEYNRNRADHKKSARVAEGGKSY